MADVVIAGGGPAGATLALLLGRAGLTRRALRGEDASRARSRAAKGSCPPASRCWSGWGCASAVGGRPLARVRYHGFGLTAEAGFPARADGRRPSRSAQRRLHLDEALLAAARATPGVRVFEEAPVEGAAIEGGRAIGLRVGGELRRGGLVVGADGLESPVRRSLGLERRARAGSRRVGVRMHFRLAAGQPEPSRLEIFVGRGYELYAAPLPDGELLLAALGDRDALGIGARAAIDALDRRASRCSRDWLDGATPLTHAGGARARHPARARRLRARRRAAGRRRARHRSADRGRHRARAGHRRAARGDRPARAGRGRRARLARFDRERRRLLRAHDWLTRALVFLVERPALARRDDAGMRAAPGADARAARRRRRRRDSAARSRRERDGRDQRGAALPISSATDQNATLSQRAGSA